MKNASISLYLDLIKKTLSFTLWPEPGIPLETFNYKRSTAKRYFIHNLTKILRRFKLQIVEIANYKEKDREEGIIWPMYAETMIGLKRLDNIQYCIEEVLKNKIEGDLIETGVWRGGACIFMKAVLSAYEENERTVFVADSFEGLPKPDATNFPADKGDSHHTENFLAVSQENVEENFRRYNLLDSKVVFLKGWFKDTLPHAPITQLSILRLDGDMYGSTMDALIHLYPKLSKGGFCIIDDYVLPGCKKATDDYRAKENIDAPLLRIDNSGVYWQKGNN
ncbi:MAG: TylF/MycF family methyltransferase [Proteobacteria bacterium]|nr:TylF/MycF family methyltransferase [Pseudomonadota bacterium]